MSIAKYEIVEQDKRARERILSSLVDSPTDGIAFLFLMAGEPMSPSEITEFLCLSDAWYVSKFHDAFRVLAEKGLIREVEAESQAIG